MFQKRITESKIDKFVVTGNKSRHEYNFNICDLGKSVIAQQMDILLIRLILDRKMLTI